MRSILILLFLPLSILTSVAQEKPALERPRLVIGIVIDQMRWDYLYRYYDRFSEDGFKRLLNKGFNCQNTMINYLPSYTGPGHAGVYTGSVPAIHGIAANDWIDNLTGRFWYCTEDTTVRPVGGSYKAGRMSPRNLLTTTITDELRLATNMHSRVFAISIKDRGSILPGGHLANGAFWFDDSTGNFMSSSYYNKQLPQWVADFNNKRYADSFMSQAWNLLYEPGTYTRSLADNNPYEGKFPGEAAPMFPHAAKITQEAGYYGLRYLPGGNTLIFKMARACIRGERLGQSVNTDFLCMSFSSTDYAGHRYGPDAREMEDMFLRMDKELASFLRFLDKNIGDGNYLLFLTADHGGAHNYQFLKDKGIPAGDKQETQLLADLNAYLKTFTYNVHIDHLTNYQVYLKKDLSVEFDHARGYLKRTIVEWLNRQPGIAYAIDLEDNIDNITPEPIKTMAANGFHRQRSGAIQIVLEPGWYSGYGPTGTTHGSWNPYDTHIPLLWYGWGIPKGETHRTVYMSDIAATLAALLHIQQPNGCVGNVITEIIR